MDSQSSTSSGESNMSYTVTSKPRNLPPRSRGNQLSSRSIVSRQSTNVYGETDSDRLDRIESDIRALKELKDGVDVKFCSLGFKHRKDSDLWLMDNSEGANVGLVVDVHSIPEHLYALIDGKDSALSNLHNLARVKLQTDIEGITVSSFEQQIHKLFYKSAFKVVKNDASYFDNIANYADWTLTDDGFHDTILASLQQFEEDHAALVDQEMKVASPLHTVAFTSLQVSVSWIEEFIRYIDTTFKEYTESKFSIKKTWNITTRLARTLLTTIGEPRSGVIRAFKTKNPKSIKCFIFFASVWSLDVIEQIAHGGLKNSPVVANELVKFLAKNTNVDAIEQLQTDMRTLQAENKKLRESLHNLHLKIDEFTKTATSGLTRANEIKATIGKLDSRLKKLEWHSDVYFSIFYSWWYGYQSIGKRIHTLSCLWNNQTQALHHPIWSSHRYWSPTYQVNCKRKFILILSSFGGSQFWVWTLLAFVITTSVHWQDLHR